jgi:hypothetical protein
MPFFEMMRDYEHGTPASSFAAMVRECLDDARIVGYFKRKLVGRDEVVNALVTGDAYVQAVHEESYQYVADAYKRLDSKLRQNSNILVNGAINTRTMAILTGLFIIVLSWFSELFATDFLTLGIITLSTILLVASGWLFVSADPKSWHRRSLIAFSLITMSMSIGLIILPHLLAKIPWDPFTQFTVWLITLLILYLFYDHKTINQFGELLILAWNKGTIPLAKWDIFVFERNWQKECAESIIFEQAVLAINTILGADKDRFLVEQDSEGLRKLQDPSFTVSTHSEKRITRALSQMDGGSIALAGPRGAGKSTLLRKFSGPHRMELLRTPCSVYLTAPAEYVPRDFIAELFQQLCETYLLTAGQALPEPIYKERPKFALRRFSSRVLSILWLCARLAISIWVFIWILHLHVRIYYSHIYPSLVVDLQHIYGSASHYIYERLHKSFKRFWTWIRLAVGVIAVLSIPRWGRWKRHIRPSKEPPLAKKAREYLLRLQVDKTVAWGATLNSSALRTVSLGISRGGTASYTPWTLPELVGHMRRFMKDIAETFHSANYAIVIGIDEIDRIGSLNHAERFIGEIKAIFGVEKCFFLVAVAEDVGSIFAQRALAGRSILENAFDDIIVVEPLSLQETSDLLLKRVPGFTDSFVYLVHALSGGLPRELIRVTRRLVEVNGELNNTLRTPRLEELAFALVREELVEAIRATRNQMGRLNLNASWAPAFEILRVASVTLRQTSFAPRDKMYFLIEQLSIMEAPKESSKAGSVGRVPAPQDEDAARRIVQDFAVFAYFGLAVIDAFSDKYFDWETVQQRSSGVPEGSYEALAVARAELTVSQENSRAIIQRFRESLSSNNTDL